MNLPADENLPEGIDPAKLAQVLVLIGQVIEADDPTLAVMVGQCLAAGIDPNSDPVVFTIHSELTRRGMFN